MGLYSRRKRNRIITVAVLSLACFVLSGCAGNKPSGNGNATNGGPEVAPMEMTDPELIASWDGDYIPAFIEKSGDSWFVIYQNYGESEYSFAAGDSPDTTDIKYEGSGEIWRLSADGDFAAWAERVDIGVNINVYDATKDEVETIAVLPETPDEYQDVYVHTKDGKVYYSLIDYEAEEKLLMCFEPATKKGDILATDLNFGRSFLAMKENVLMYESKGEDGELCLTLFDTVSGKSSEQVPLPNGVDILWNADIEGDYIAAYYYDTREGKEAWNENDNINVFRRGEETDVPIFSFPKTDSGATYYAYNDDIELFGDRILWVYQANTSGNILDHYYLTVYNYLTHDYENIPAAYHFMTDEDDLYWLCFNEGICKADLYKSSKKSK